MARLTHVFDGGRPTDAGRTDVGLTKQSSRLSEGLNYLLNACNKRVRYVVYQFRPVMMSFPYRKLEEDPWRTASL